MLHILPLGEELSRLQVVPTAPSRLCYLLVSSALCSSAWFSPEKAYPQYMQLLFQYVRCSPLRHSLRVPASILTQSSVQLCAARAARFVFDFAVASAQCAY